MKTGQTNLRSFIDHQRMTFFAVFNDPAVFYHEYAGWYGRSGHRFYRVQY